MKRIIGAAAALALLSGGAGVAVAQPHYGDRDRGHNDSHDRDGPGADMGRRHHDWRRGGRIERSDWSRGSRVDYRRHHLRRPPRGYEWREVDGNYVLAAAATGLIASIIASSQ